MIKRLAHVCIGATDLAETERFYRDLLVMEKAFDFFRAGRQIGFYLKAGESTFIEVFIEIFTTSSSPLLPLSRATLRFFDDKRAEFEAVATADATAGG